MLRLWHYSSIVAGDIPLLLSHGAMEILDLSYHARSRTVYLGEGDTCIQAFRTIEPHPMISLMDFPSNGFEGDFDLSKDLTEVRISTISSKT
jgi:hypothetical protein